MHKTTQAFWKYFNNLPEKIKKLSREQFSLLKKNPRHPSLHFKKVGQLWSVRISLDYRALSYKDEENFIWVWIGTHEEYNNMLNKKG